MILDIIPLVISATSIFPACATCRIATGNCGRQLAHVSWGMTRREPVPVQKFVHHSGNDGRTFAREPVPSVLYLFIISATGIFPSCATCPNCNGQLRTQHTSRAVSERENRFACKRLSIIPVMMDELLHGNRFPLYHISSSTGVHIVLKTFKTLYL